jgi:probable F420-dependent oxidoreductase
MAPVRFGVFGINSFAAAEDPAGAARALAAAEAAGWESAWVGEHYVLPDPAVPESPAPPDTPMLDPFVSLAHLAAHTSTLLLATGLVVVPVHHPVALAKRVASLDRVCGGRLLLGVGVGYLAPEFAAFDVPLAGRGERTDDALAAMATLWSGGTSHDGPSASFAGVRAAPGPVRPSGPPIHVGGHAAPALRRAVRHGCGWYGWMLDPAAAGAHVATLRSLARAAGRTDPLEVTVTPPPGLALDGATVDAYAAAGVDRLVLIPPGRARRSTDELAAWLSRPPPA